MAPSSIVRGLLIGLVASIAFLVSSPAWAAPYGSGTYGGSDYNSGEEAVSEADRSSSVTGYMPQARPAQIATTSGTTTVPTRSLFTRFLQRNDTHPDVERLQQYLNTNGFPLATSGVGSSGNETDFFGPLTYSALVRFQTAHAAAILVPLGLSVGTGYFGAATIAFIAGQ